MLTAVKTQLRVTGLSIKYAIMREMVNKVTFISNIIFMLLNNASFIIQWIILYSIKDGIGGYEFKQVLLLWGIAAGTYGIAHFFFKDAFELSKIINIGKLDVYLVQPKNVLLSVVTATVSPSALGDIIYAYIMLILYGITPLNFILFTILLITGGIIIVNISIIFNSLAFWYGKSETIAEAFNSTMTNVATYPEGIFNGIIKIIFYTIIPLGIVNYIPIRLLSNFDIRLFIVSIGFCIFTTLLSFGIFHLGLKKYSSTNLMNARI